MRFILFSFAAILLLNSALAVDLALPKTCEDVLPADTCARLRDVAQKFNEKVGIVNQAIIDAYKHHKTRAAEALSYVKEYLVTRAQNFKCENVISPENCKRINDIAKKLHLTATQVSLAIKEAMVNGAQKVTDIYNKAVAFMRDRLSNLKCEDVLGADNCKKLKDFAAVIHVKATEVNIAIREAVIEGAANAKAQFQKAMEFLQNEVTCDKVLGEDKCNALREAAQKLHENIKIVNDAVKAAVQKHLTKAADILKSVRDTIVAKAQNFKCTDVLSADQCTKISSIGQRLKLKSAEISLAIKEAVVNGAEQAKQIYNRAIGFLLNDVKNLKCEDLISADTCAKIKEYALKVHAKATDVAVAIKEAIVQGASNAKDYYKKSVEFLKAKISCENVMSEETCDKIRGLADKFSISLAKVDAALREAIANGVTKVSDLYKAAVKFIMDKWASTFGDEPEKVKRGLGDKIDEISQKLKEKLRKAVDTLLDALKITDQKIRETVKKAVEAGKIKFNNLKEKIQELIASLNKNDEESASDVANIYKRSIREQLVDTLKNVKGKVKEFIEKLLNFSKDKLEKMKNWIKEKLNEKGVTIRSDELEEDFAYVNDLIKESTEETFNNLVEDAMKNIDEE